MSWHKQIGKKTSLAILTCVDVTKEEFFPTGFPEDVGIQGPWKVTLRIPEWAGWNLLTIEDRERLFGLLIELYTGNRDNMHFGALTKFISDDGVDIYNDLWFHDYFSFYVWFEVG